MKGEWQPMETAPKDGTLLLGWDRSNGCYAVSYHPCEGTCYEWETSDGYAACPSHWTPLPEPPEVKP